MIPRILCCHFPVDARSCANWRNSSTAERRVSWGELCFPRVLRGIAWPALNVDVKRCQTMWIWLIFSLKNYWVVSSSPQRSENTTTIRYYNIYILIFCGKEQTCYSRLPRVLRRQAVSHRCSQRRLTSVSCEMSFEHGNRCRCGWGAEEPFDAWRVRNCWKESVKVRKVLCDSCLQWWLQLHPWDLNC